jgi:hypothetical protein
MNEWKQALWWMMQQILSKIDPEEATFRQIN